MLPSEKRVAIVEIGKIRSPNNMMELNLITKVFPSIQVWKIFGKPHKKEDILERKLPTTTTKNQKLQMGWLDLPFFEQDFCSFLDVQRFQSQGRPFGSSRPFGSFGSGCAGTRASGARTSWTRGGWVGDLNFPWWWEHPPVTNGFFNQITNPYQMTWNEWASWKKTFDFLSFVGFFNVS